ncbi:tRNA pseudouridine(13) synthase TruD [Salinicola sp. RZ23]|uniref:tRNA pseudouridine(13) synthase TruD n=1 Tax=Salinicola sp. RZ23 TaxID=1949087 RepID=UPI000DA26917|nr:tRNA pseudouridine(13) synthase TruD [Salinicola sp. RZ23]
MPVWPPGWAHVETAPSVEGSYRDSAEAFQVEEVLDFTPEGEGEHLWVWIEKRGVTTPDAARSLARQAQIAVRDVGFSGLKDRDAVTRQWMSLALPGRTLAPGWEAPLAERGIHVLRAVRHPRKLKRGVHRANRFRLRVSGPAASSDDVRQRWERLVAQGVPNYFGPQRFGPEGRNLQRALALFARGWRKREDPQGLLLSTARSYLFNQVLAARVADGSWCRPLAGDVLNLEGSASRFLAEAAEPELEARAVAGDLHPTGPLWGQGEPHSRGEVALLEQREAAACAALRDGLAAAGARHERRALRILPAAASWSAAEAERAAWLEFSLPRGAFATAVLRELMRHPTLV